MLKHKQNILCITGLVVLAQAVAAAVWCSVIKDKPTTTTKTHLEKREEQNKNVYKNRGTTAGWAATVAVVCACALGYMLRAKAQCYAAIALVYWNIFYTLGLRVVFEPEEIFKLYGKLHTSTSSNTNAPDVPKELDNYYEKYRNIQATNTSIAALAFTGWLVWL